MSTYKSIDSQVTRTTELNQLVDIIQEDISGSFTRKAYQVFVTGGVGPGVTSSLYQTVHDQDFTLQTANPIFDMTVGLSRTSGVITESLVREDTSTGKLFFASSSLMMREKVDIYRQYAANLLGDADANFFSPISETHYTKRIDEAVFLSFKRLFVRDGIKRETFAMRLFTSAAFTYGANSARKLTCKIPNIDRTSISGSDVVTDLGSASSQRRLFGGEVGELVLASNTNNRVGLVFYNAGTVVLDAKRVFSASQHISGTISAMNSNTAAYMGGRAGFTLIGGRAGTLNGLNTGIYRNSKARSGNPNAKFIPDLFVSASIDDIIDHIATTRFSSGSLTATTFQNTTNITSKLIFCRVGPDDFNYSSNPTFTDADGRLRVISVGDNRNERPFTFPTTIGLYNEQHQLLAVAKLSRPIEKNDMRDLTFRIRLDF